MGIREFARMIAAIPALIVGLALIKVVGVAEEIYPLRRWLIYRDILGYTVPDARAIRECSECNYRGVLEVDKHQPAPMSDTNWGLFCPECRQEMEGPMHASEVGDYINLCQPSDGVGPMIEMGNYGAFKTVQAHNSRYALPETKIDELQAADRAKP